jgi:itaconyl-CoA hydratase
MNSSVVTYFEDFTVGDIYEHSRGRTVTNFDNYSITHMSMNTAEAHFNLPYSLNVLDGRFRDRIVAGPCTIAIVVGLTSQDMSENAFMDVGLTGIKLHHPVFAGDTLHARSEVLAVEEDTGHNDTGMVRYRFSATNQDGKLIAEGERTIRLKKRSAWEARDKAAQKLEITP